MDFHDTKVRKIFHICKKITDFFSLNNKNLYFPAEDDTAWHGKGLPSAGKAPLSGRKEHLTQGKGRRRKKHCKNCHLIIPVYSPPLKRVYPTKNQKVAVWKKADEMVGESV